MLITVHTSVPSGNTCNRYAHVSLTLSQRGTMNPYTLRLLVPYEECFQSILVLFAANQLQHLWQRPSLNDDQRLYQTRAYGHTWIAPLSQRKLEFCKFKVWHSLRTSVQVSSGPALLWIFRILTRNTLHTRVPGLSIDILLTVKLARASHNHRGSIGRKCRHHYVEPRDSNSDCSRRDVHRDRVCTAALLPRTLASRS